MVETVTPNKKLTRKEKYEVLCKELKDRDWAKGDITDVK